MSAGLGLPGEGQDCSRKREHSVRIFFFFKNIDVDACHCEEAWAKIVCVYFM